ncbi:HSP90 family protein [Deinococcus sp. RIT780]|uniref:HSP90 family protein n=1 Tax=Deinococcus sp. RIT780 TaxID=2870472 RepID=UPI001C8A05A9|nr:HSP90 family protein [Deinococcus sp. RIT780]MBX8464832.1 HSP90 family protein [Deinococcus sp. RIT780]
MTRSFAVDLRGLIDLLSEHLYAGPEVYVRELMQNGVDAIRARTDLGDTFSPALTFDVQEGRLTFTDNGVGLSPDDIHTFLATIGRSSKRGSVEFIGQFGIGLLACFLVSEEIELVSRSARGTPPVRWVGRADGSYTLLTGEDAGLPDGPVGTQITLRARPDRAAFLLPDRVAAWAAEYGALLPYPVTLVGPAGPVSLNATGAPWLDHSRGEEARRAATLAYGEALLNAPPLDFVDVNTHAGAVRGVAFILPWTPSLDARGHHRVYVRHMLLSEQEEQLTPRWAFFVKTVLDAGTLRPNAARDALRDDADLHAAREEIAGTLRDWLLGLAREQPGRLRELITLHYLSIKALAAEDDEFLTLFLPWLPFESSAGRQTLPELLERSGGELRFVADLNLYRQAAQLAAPGGPPVIHAVYTYDHTLLERYGALNPQVRVTRLSAADLVQDLAPPTLAERRATATLLAAAQDTLAPLDAGVRLSHFEPAALCAMAFPGAQRDLHLTRQAVGPSGGLWADLLDDLREVNTDTYAMDVHFNLNHPLVQRAAHLPDGPLLRRVLGMLYVQALLLGHHPLTARELELLNGGLLDLIGVALGDPDASRPAPHLN